MGEEGVNLSCYSVIKIYVMLRVSVFVSVNLAVLYVVSQGVDHRPRSSFSTEQVEFIQSL